MKTGSWKILALLAVFATAGLVSDQLYAAGWTAKYRGKIVVLRSPAPPGVADKSLHEWIKANAITGRAQDSPGTWQVHLFSVFKSKPATSKIYLLFYDKADKEAIKKREPTEVLEIPVKPTAMIFMTSVDLEEEAGFNAERRYVIRFVVATSRTERLLASGEIALVREAP